VNAADRHVSSGHREVLVEEVVPTASDQAVVTGSAERRRTQPPPFKPCSRPG